MCLMAVALLHHVHIFFPLPHVLDYIFHFDRSRGKTVSLASGIPSMLWGVGAIKEGPIPGDTKGQALDMAVGCYSVY